MKLPTYKCPPSILPFLRPFESLQEVRKGLEDLVKEEKEGWYFKVGRTLQGGLLPPTYPTHRLKIFNHRV